MRTELFLLGVLMFCFLQIDQRTNGFVMMFRKDNIVDPPSAPHGGLWSLADLGTFSIAPGVEDFGLCLTLGYASRCPWCGGLWSLSDLGLCVPVPLAWRSLVFV